MHIVVYQHQTLVLISLCQGAVCAGQTLFITVLDLFLLCLLRNFYCNDVLMPACMHTIHE